MLIAMLLPIAVLLIGLGLSLPAPAWFPRAAYIVATVLAGVVLVLLMVGSGSIR